MSLETAQSKVVLQIINQLFEAEPPTTIQSPELTDGYTLETVPSLNIPDHLDQVIQSIATENKNYAGSVLALLAVKNPRNPTSQHLIQISRHPSQDGHRPYATIGIFTKHIFNDNILFQENSSEKADDNVTELRLEGAFIRRNVDGDKVYIQTSIEDLRRIFPYMHIPGMEPYIPFLNFDNATIEIPRELLVSGAIPK